MFSTKLLLPLLGLLLLTLLLVKGSTTNRGLTTVPSPTTQLATPSPRGGGSCLYAPSLTITPPSCVEVNQPVTFSLNFSDQDPGSYPLGFYVEFGDNTNTGDFILPPITHTYTTTGNKTVSAWAMDNCDFYSDEATTIIQVLPAGSCGGPATNLPPVVNTGPDQTVTLLPRNPTTNTPPPTPPCLQGTNPTTCDRDYPLIATAHLTATTTDDGLPLPPQLTSYWTKLSGPDPVLFQNAKSLTTNVYVYRPGVYTIRLSVTDGQLTTTDDLVITVTNPTPPTNQPPVANAGPNQTTLACTATTSLSFNGNLSSDPDGTITAYLWNWGDGTPNTSGITANHTFTARTQPYTVTLTVTDNQGAQNSDTTSITVTPNASPSANAGLDQTTPINQPLSFQGSGQDPDNQPLTYDWDWGDGTTHGTTAVATHTYTTAGTYQATLKVKDSCNVETTDTTQVVVNAGGALQALFKVEELTDIGDPANPNDDVWVEVGDQTNPIESGLKVRYNGSYSTGPVYFWQWRRNGSIICTQVVCNNLTQLGPTNYTLDLRVYDNQGNPSNVTKTISVGGGMGFLSQMPSSHCH